MENLLEIFIEKSKNSKIYLIEKNRRIDLLRVGKIPCKNIRFASRSGNGLRSCFLPRKLSKPLAYLVGYFMGDGSLIKGVDRYCVSFACKSIVLAKNKLIPIIRSIFDVEPKISNYNRCYELRINLKPLYLFFHYVFELPMGPKKYKLKIPTVVSSSPLNIRIEFIKGFFEADGCICNTDKTYSLMFKQSSRKLLEDIKSIISECGVKINGPYYDKQNDSWLIGTWKRESINKLIGILNIDAAVVQTVEKPGLV